MSMNISKQKNNKGREISDVNKREKITKTEISLAEDNSSSVSKLGDSSVFQKLTRCLDKLSNSSLNLYYKDPNLPFRKKVDELNLKFYLETEKYLSSKSKDEKSQSVLFLLLFQQISILTDEIERLNKVIISNEAPNQRSASKTKDALISTLKESKEKIEKKLSEVLERENSLFVENDKLKKENIMYKSTIKNYLRNKDKNEERDQRFSDLTQANSNMSNDVFNEITSTSLSNNFIKKTTPTLLNKSNTKKGLIKKVKQNLMSKGKKNYCLNSNFNNYNNYSLFRHNDKENFETFMNELNIKDYKSKATKLNENRKTHIKTEIIVSDLEEFYSKKI